MRFWFKAKKRAKKREIYFWENLWDYNLRNLLNLRAYILSHADLTDFADMSYIFWRLKADMKLVWLKSALGKNLRDWNRCLGELVWLVKLVFRISSKCGWRFALHNDAMWRRFQSVSKRGCFAYNHDSDSPTRVARKSSADIWFRMAQGGGDM